MKKGFSLGEMLITMIIMGIMVAITLPMLTQSVEKINKQAYKAAFISLTDVVNELIIDTASYPSGVFTTGEDLCDDFFDIVNTIGANSCSTTAVVPGTPNFITTNGNKWYFFDSTPNSFQTTCPGSGGNNCILVYVDINGNKGKNTETGDEDHRDILRFYISKFGNVYVPDDGPEGSYL